MRTMISTVYAYIIKSSGGACKNVWCILKYVVYNFSIYSQTFGIEIYSQNRKFVNDLKSSIECTQEISEKLDSLSTLHWQNLPG